MNTKKKLMIKNYFKKIQQNIKQNKKNKTKQRND